MTETNLTMSTICSPSDDLVAREIEGELIIVPLVSGMGDADDELYSLNPTGQAIWLRLDGARTLGQITEELAQEYDAPPALIEQDLLGLMGELIKRRMVIVH
jgi:hypothetical protein